MPNEELKPCPFCGGKAELKRYTNGASAWSAIYCTECGVKQDSIKNGYFNDNEAIKAWNRRAEKCD